MDLRPSDEQQELVQAFAALYGRHATPERVRSAEPLGFDKALWDQLLELGVVAMAVDEERGGWGASLVDLALVAEQHGRAVAPAPLVEAQTAARLLARLDGAAASASLDAALAGERLVTIAVRPAAAGQAALVPAAAVADDALVVDGDRLLLVPLEGARTSVENVGSMPVADVDVRGGIELAGGAAAADAVEAALDDWLTLTANALVGVGARALELGVEYVKDRKAWNVPIGSFQAVSHRLADAATALDGARLLALEAAWSAAAAPERHRELAALAFGFAAEAARDATSRSLQFHGGYGFMLEYDVQLHWRRARAWAGVWGEPRLAYQRAGDARYGR